MEDAGLYVEADFILALIEDDDRLRDSAEAIYDEHEDDLWTSLDILIELMMVAYREGWNVERVVADTNVLLEVGGDTDTVLAAASHVQEHGFTPFDALHLVNSGGSSIVSSDDSYDDFTDRIPLEAGE